MCQQVLTHAYVCLQSEMVKMKESVVQRAADLRKQMVKRGLVQVVAPVALCGGRGTALCVKGCVVASESCGDCFGMSCAEHLPLSGSCGAGSECADGPIPECVSYVVY